MKALEAMRIARVNVGDGADVTIDVNQKGRPPDQRQRRPGRERTRVEYGLAGLRDPPLWTDLDNGTMGGHSLLRGPNLWMATPSHLRCGGLAAASFRKPSGSAPGKRSPGLSRRDRLHSQFISLTSHDELGVRLRPVSGRRRGVRPVPSCTARHVRCCPGGASPRDRRQVSSRLPSQAARLYIRAP